MGLSIYVGLLAEQRETEPSFLPESLRRIELLRTSMRGLGLVGTEYRATARRFAALRACLRASGVASYKEPIELKQRRSFSCQMWGYSGLHHLRRYAAYLAVNHPSYVPARKLPDDTDQLVRQYYSEVGDGSESGLPFQHLMLHSDAEGYYVPEDFPRVIDPGNRYFKAVGGPIGSTQRLLAECEQIANHLQLPLSLDPESSDVWQAADEPGKGDRRWQHYGIESFSCLRLVHACKHSIETGAAIVFC